MFTILKNSNMITTFDLKARANTILGVTQNSIGLDPSLKPTSSDELFKFKHLEMELIALALEAPLEDFSYITQEILFRFKAIIEFIGDTYLPDALAVLRKPYTNGNLACLFDPAPEYQRYNRLISDLAVLIRNGNFEDVIKADPITVERDYPEFNTLIKAFQNSGRLLMSFLEDYIRYNPL